MSAIIEDPLPVLEPLPSGPQDVDFNAIIEIAERTGVNDAMDQLVAQGVSPEQAGRMLESAGFAITGNAQPEQFAGGENLPKVNAPQEVRRAEPTSRKSTGSRMDLSFIQRLNDPNLSEEQARAEYEKLPPALRYVYDRTADFSYNNQGSDTPAQLDPRDAAGWLDEFYKTQANTQQTDKANRPLGEREMKIAIDDIATARNIIQQIRTHKGRSGALGYRMTKPEYAFGLKDKPIAGSAAAGFAGLIEQADAQVFQQVIPRLRGFGNMTEAEGQRAVRAGSRLSIDISEDDFTAAERDLEDFVDRAEARITGRPLEEIKQARQPIQGAQPSRTPSPMGSPAPVPSPSPARQVAATNPLQEALSQLGEEEVIRGRDGKDVRVRMIKKPDGTVRYVPVGPVQQQ